MGQKLTLQSLARRIEKLERALATQGKSRRKKDWRRVVGIGDGSQTMEDIIAAGEAIRKADREAIEQ